MRRGAPGYAELGPYDDWLSHQQLIAAMHAYPRLIPRPVVFANGNAALGRRPQYVLPILSDRVAVRCRAWLVLDEHPLKHACS